MTMFVFIIELGFPMMAIIVGYEAQSAPFPWNEVEYLARTICHILDFLQFWFIPSNSFTKL